MAETFRVPQGVQDEAKTALGWIADGHAGSGFTAVGKKRASDLAAGHPVSAETILRMYSFFKRHETDKQAEGFNSGEDGFPSAGRVAWSAWGGDAGFTWSTRIRNQISKSARALSMMASEDDMADMNQVPDLNEELTELLADVVSFYFRAHGAHWNVKGADFSEYHKLFQKIYEDVYESIDPLAENLRKLGSIAPFTLGSFMALRCLEDAPTILQDPIALANDLLTANDMILDELSDAFDCASMYNQQGIANFLAGRIDSHQYWKWQLTVSQGQEVTQPSVDPVDAQGVDEDDVEEQVDGMTMPMMMAYSEDVSELTEEERASAARIGEGSFVSWNTSNGRAKGKVEKVATKGQAKSSEGYTIEATPDHPAFVIRIYKEQGNGWVPTDVTTVHRPDILTVITALPAPRSEDVEMIEARKAMATAERITMTAEVRSVDTEDGSLKIGGYAATFNSEATGLNFREVIAPGAFTRALASADPVFLLVNHDMEGIPLASTQSGTLNLRQDSTGLYMEATLDPANPKAQELSSAVRRGDMDKMSFAFTVSPDGQTKDAGLRTLTDIERLYEVSVVTLPAYDSTSVGMRTAEEVDLDLAKRKLSVKVKQYSLTRKSKA
jgi:HK97 family phage prohead protease